VSKTYKYFLFDLDRTLWDFDANAENNICNILEKYNLKVEGKKRFYHSYDKINHILWADYEKGLLSKEKLRGERFYQTFLEYGIDDRELAEKIGIEYLNEMPNQKILMPHAFEVLSALKERGARMALISNGFKEVQYTKLKNSGIDCFFESVMISEEQGVHKPSPVIFNRALKAIDGTKHESIMVGDDFANDIEGAMIFGIDQFFYNYKLLPCNGAPTYNSSDLRDLLIFSSQQ
jgi:putative hydrolase of the HAD superfamily